MLLGGIISVHATIIELTVQIDDDTPTCPSTPKTPAGVPVVDQNGNVIIVLNAVALRAVLSR